MAGQVAFVGRDGELSRLLGALGGDARLVLVTGDAGVGKTRFVGEGMARAVAAGMVVVRGECLPLVGRLPLLPVASALSELGRLEGGGLLEAGLERAPGFVRGEVGRLVPALGSGVAPGPAGRDGGWQRERLFAAVAELLDAVTGSAGAQVGLVIEDVHWADSETLDWLTYLGGPGRRGAVRVVVTCRSDEAPLEPQVVEWLAQVRGRAEVEEIRLGPLSRAEVEDQVAALAGGPVPPQVVDELFVRAEGNPFFTEQLTVAAVADSADGELHVPEPLPARLAELLVTRAGRCTGDAQTVLNAMAVAGRPLPEDLLGAVTGLDAEAIGRGLRELATVRLLSVDSPEGAHRPRHALLAEAVANGLLPGERVVLHERTARALAAAGNQTRAAEVAGHWQAAGCPGEELSARVAAAEAAGRLFGYAEAAAHWQRAIELCQAQHGAGRAASVDVPQMYVHAIDALDLSGGTERAGMLAEEAYRRFGDHPEPFTAAVICHRAAYWRAIEAPAAALPLIKKSLRLFGQAPPSADHAQAWLDYAQIFLFQAEGEQQASLTAINHALEIAETAGATSLLSRLLPWLAFHAFLRGQVDEGFANLQRGWALAWAAEDGPALSRLAVNESDALLKLAKFQSAADVALRGLETARQTGLQAWYEATILAANAAEALLALGRTNEAAELIDPLTAGPPDRDHLVVHEVRAEIDLLRGDIEAATQRRQIGARLDHVSSIDHARESAQLAAELALWAARPRDALQEARRVLALYTAPDLTIFCARLLAAGMRACADLAEQARARRDSRATAAAEAAADVLASWADQTAGTPFTDHPLVATIPAERATWNAERSRLAGENDPGVWSGAAKAWQDLGCPHRAGYAWWRQAQAQLDAGQPATVAAAALRAAAAAADGHEPLLAQVRLLAERARIPLDAPAATAGTPTPYGLTGRELAVLRLVAAGRSNTQIGAELFISPRTAGVHVTNILRKLGVTNRVQAAGLAERAGLLDTPRR